MLVSSQPRLVGFRGLLVLAACWALLGLEALAAAPSPAEVRAYETALRFFQTGAWDLAEAELSGFTRSHPASEKLGEVRLLQAQCLHRLGRHADALALLREHVGAAGPLTDQYLFWIGESQMGAAQPAEAVLTFSRLLSEFPASGRRLDASVGQAYAAYRSGQIDRAFELLDRADGVFQQAAGARPLDEAAVRGRLLHAEIALQRNNPAAAAGALATIPFDTLPPGMEWQARMLQARTALSQRDYDAAAGTLTNLLAAATNAPPELRGDATLLLGHAIQSRGDADGALAVYERLLQPGFPEGQRRSAAQRIAGLTVSDVLGDAAVQRLERVLLSRTNDVLLDPLRLTVGEMRLKDYFALREADRPAGSNLVQLAGLQFDQVLAGTNVDLGARAHLNRGWCDWETGLLGRGSNAIVSALAHFTSAAERLPRGDAQAVARFKAGDCLSQLGQWPAAVGQYWLVITNYADLPSVQSDLTGQALHQLVRAAVAAGDLKSAEAAMSRLLAEVPAESLVVNSLLVYGQSVNRLGDPARARAFYNTFLEKFGGSGLVPEVQLALIRTLETEGKWKEAATLYDSWLARFPSHGMLAAAEFGRAWATYLSGNETNSFGYFTNYLARFPTGPQAPLAQSWIGDYHFRGERFDQAELDFQKVFQNTNWPASPVSFQARLMAGRAAFMRQGYTDAVGYLTNLINHPQCPPGVLPQAYFALADTYMRAAEAAGPSTNLLNNYVQALGLLEKITTGFSTNRLSALAWGRTGDCLFQLAVADSALYERAFTAYTNVIRFPGTDVAARSQAEVGLGRIREKQAALASGANRPVLYSEALRHYLNVVEGKNLGDGEEADPFWIKEAALSAARLAEEQQRWEVAANLYRRLITFAPGLRRTWEARLEKLAQSGGGGAAKAP